MGSSAKEERPLVVSRRAILAKRLFSHYYFVWENNPTFVEHLELLGWFGHSAPFVDSTTQAELIEHSFVLKVSLQKDMNWERSIPGKVYDT